MDPWAGQKAQAMAFFDSMPQHMRPATVLSPPEASRKAEAVRRELFASWHRLKKLVLAHEETIQKRWKKRTGAKRKQLLQEIDPRLPKEHAPEVSAFSQGNLTQDKLIDFLLPYLNLEDLTINNGTQFLGLLHARAHYFPSQFAWFDSNTLHFGIVAGAIPRPHGVDCAMVSFGDESTYGKVLEYDEPLSRADLDSPDESMSFGDGLAVLETQAKLTKFLLAVVSKILCDIDLTNPTPVAPLSAPDIPVLNTTLQWQSSARSNAMRPYGRPPAFSIDEIAVLLEAQHELAVQHLADLRTDPIYLAETIQSYYDHRPETILGKAPPALIQNRSVSLMLSDAYSFFAFYHVANTLVAEFRVAQARFPEGIPRAREPDEEYENAFRKFYPILALIEMHVTKVHRTTMCSSSALRPGLSVRSNDPAFAKHDMILASVPGDELYSYMKILLQDQQTHLWQLTRIFDQLDHITQDPIAHQRISPLIANLLSQWGVVNDCKSILEWHRPAIEDNEDPQQSIQNRLQEWHPLLASIIQGKSPDGQLANKAFPLSRFTYPKGPRNSAWSTKCQAVDTAFTAFWTAADRMLVKMAGKELFALGAEVVAPFAVPSTDWAALGAPKAVVRQKPAATALLPFGGAEQLPASKDEVSAAKVKPKTRKEAVISTEDMPREQETEKAVENLAIPPTLVSARVYKVFSTLFNAAKDEQVALQQSSVAWKDILSAFNELRFELRKTRGSAWTFRQVDGPKSVTVHEPHPESMMRFWEARRFGRRLTKRFGWTLESFVLDSTAA
ncbi:hypothetical protein DFH06DRAFT_1081972 [Mycena polygramma]|nr:hypothetical protein DFH06DRAFT_1081972 [Mycena polygramma]